jgi:LPS sulfotransferase NodH
MWVFASTTKEFAMDPETTGRVQRVIVVASTARSGSTLLCRALSGSGRAGAPTEYFNPDFYRDRLRSVPFGDVSMRGRVGQARRLLTGDAEWRRVTLARLSKGAAARLVRDIGVEHASADGVFGVKFMWSQYQPLLHRGFGAEVWGAPVSWVSIRRADHLRQAVSFCMAEQTRQWTATEERRATAQYAPDRIAGLMQSFADHERLWDRYFQQIGVQPLRVTYEQLDADYERTVADVLAHLGCAGAPVVPRALERQSDEVTEEWIERYRRERGGPAGIE